MKEVIFGLLVLLLTGGIGTLQTQVLHVADGKYRWVVGGRCMERHRSEFVNLARCFLYRGYRDIPTR